MAIPKAKLKNLYIKEIAGVYRGAQGKQPAVIMKRRAPATLFARVVKTAVITDEVDGHQHTIDLGDPCERWCSTYSTSYQTAAGADDGHSHAWTYDPATGSITVAADSGHTHAVTEVVPPDVIAAAAVHEAAEKQRRAKEVAAAVLGGEVGSGATITVDVQPTATLAMRAPEGVSPPSATTPTVKSQEQVMADAKDEQIAALTKTVARLEQLASLTDAQRAHHGTLRDKDADVFLAKSAKERDAVLVELEKANEVVHTSTVDGTVYRKSDDPRLVAMAKRADATAVELAKAQAATEQVAIEKRATDLIPMIGKLLAERVAILKGVEAIPDETVRKGAIEALRGAQAALVMLTKAHGANPGDAPVAGSPKAAFDAERTNFAKAKFKTEAPSELQIKQVTAEFMKTERGAELYAELSTPAQA